MGAARHVTTVCPYCGVGCVFDVEVVDGHAKRIEYVSDHPVTEGALCPKGNAALEILYHTDRLRYPLARRNGRLERIGWDEAVAMLAERLETTRARDGADAVGFLASAKVTNEEAYLMQKLARLFGTNNVDHCARLCHASTVSGLAMTLGAGAMTNPLSDLAKSDCIFVIGSNFPENHPVASRWALDAKEAGATVVLADPRKTPVSWTADLHLQQRPGSDVALLNAMAHVILRDGLVNEEFVEKRTTGFAELAELLRGLDLAEAAAITGVEVAAIERAARAYAQAEAGAIVWSMGITQHTHGTDNVACCANLALVTGHIGRPGAGLFPLRGQSNVQGACDQGALANVYPGYVPVGDEAGRRRIAEAWGADDLPAEPGLTIVEMIRAAHSGDLSLLYVMGENPMVSDPDTDRVREALRRVDFLAVQDIFLTETAELADLVLPAACWAEKAGTITATERRVQWQEQVVAPAGEVRTDWRIVCDVAAALGLGDRFAYGSVEEILEEINRVVPAYGGITHGRVRRPGGLVWPCADEEHPGTPILHAESFKTPDGLGRLTPVEYRPPVEPPDDAYPLVLTTGRTVLHYNSGSMTRRSKALLDREAELFVEIHPEDAGARGIAPDERVVVESRRGRADARAVVTDKVAHGVVFMPFHFPGTNALTVEDLDPIAKIPELKVAACQIRKA